MHRAASTGNAELCEFLIEEGAEVDAVDRTGQTPLTHAVICENKGVCCSGFIASDLLICIQRGEGNLHALLVCICEVTSNIALSVLLLI